MSEHGEREASQYHTEQRIRFGVLRAQKRLTVTSRRSSTTSLWRVITRCWSGYICPWAVGGGGLRFTYVATHVEMVCVRSEKKNGTPRRPNRTAVRATHLRV